jgi:hypothetical protein
MDKEELIEFLKENLSINIELTYDGELKVDLSLDGDLISSDSIYLPEKDKSRYWD